MKFLVNYEYRGANYYKVVKSGREVANLKRKYYVYRVKRID